MPVIVIGVTLVLVWALYALLARSVDRMSETLRQIRFDEVRYRNIRLLSETAEGRTVLTGTINPVTSRRDAKTPLGQEASRRASQTPR